LRVNIYYQDARGWSCLALVSLRCRSRVEAAHLLCGRAVHPRGETVEAAAFGPRHFLPPAAAYTHKTIYIMNNSKHALTINQPDNQLLKCYNKNGSVSCATAVQAASKTTLHACKTTSSYWRTLRE
jgi:hypothetical protein